MFVIREFPFVLGIGFQSQRLTGGQVRQFEIASRRIDQRLHTQCGRYLDAINGQLPVRRRRETRPRHRMCWGNRVAARHPVGRTRDRTFYHRRA